MSDPELGRPELGRLEFAAAPAAVGCARRWTAGLLAQSGPGDLVDTAVLLVSELVTNAVRASAAAPRGSGGPDHGSGGPDHGQIELIIVRTSDMLRIEVYDSSLGSLPSPADHVVDSDGEGGRGLQVINALSERWGWRPAKGGKVVWCELPLAGDCAKPPGQAGHPLAIPP
jgi:anti-sigma regulatory factor (Ser/Thr protein kinase)